MNQIETLPTERRIYDSRLLQKTQALFAVHDAFVSDAKSLNAVD